MSEPDLDAARAKIIAVCRDLLENRIDLIPGCRRLASLRHDIQASGDSAFHHFIAVASETDHLPFGNVRAHCSDEWLAKADKEIEEVTQFYRTSIQAAAVELIDKLQAKSL